MRILIALDGSECSRQIIDHCLKCNWGKHTQFKVITVVDFFEPLPALVGIKEGEIAAAQKLVETEAGRLISLFPSLNVSYRVLDGYVKSAIVEIAREWRADLIMLGSHGRRGFQKLLLGSISQAMVNHVTTSVRIVRDVGEDHKDKFEVVLCLDDSRYSRASLDSLLAYSWPDVTCFSVVSVVFPLPDAPDASDSAKFQLEDKKKKLDAEAMSILNSAERKIKDKFGEKCMVEKFAPVGEAREEILKILETRKPQLVMMGSHGRGAFDRALMGSVSEAVVNLAKCSVEVVR